jgi:UDPglucose--hexose-1-phosphate uridylyltransferase
VFKNYGASAGASMSHSHSQLLALPVVPPNVSARLDSMKEFFHETGKCSICEIRVEDLLIDESSHFISIVPFAASFPFEMWIIPRHHSSHFHELDGAKVIINCPFGFSYFAAPSLGQYKLQLSCMTWST